MPTEGEQIEGAAEGAALAELRGTSFPPTDDDLENIAGAAGGAAAAAACTAYGAGAAAPLCARIGSAVSEFVADKIIGGFKSVFGRRNRAAWREYEQNKRNAEATFNVFHLAGELAELQGQTLTEIETSLEALYVDLHGRPSGGDWNDWRRVLAFVGAPMVVSEGATWHGKPLYVPSVHPVKAWNDLASSITPENAPGIYGGIARMVTDELEVIGRAATAVAARMVATATAEKANELAAEAVAVERARGVELEAYARGLREYAAALTAAELAELGRVLKANPSPIAPADRTTARSLAVLAPAVALPLGFGWAVRKLSGRRISPLWGVGAGAAWGLVAGSIVSDGFRAGIGRGGFVQPVRSEAA